MVAEPYVTRALNAVVKQRVQRTASVVLVAVRHSMVFTNVPGPTEPIVFMGSRVREIVFACSNLVNQVSALSYAGRLPYAVVVERRQEGCHRADSSEIDALGATVIVDVIDSLFPIMYNGIQ